jgi:hypothetical protein
MVRVHSCCRIKYAGMVRGHDCSLLWLPGEATTSLGRLWRDEALDSSVTPGGQNAVFVIGLANGSMAYLTSREEYLGGGYEAVATLHGPETGESVGAALLAALAEARRLRWR